MTSLFLRKSMRNMFKTIRKKEMFAINSVHHSLLRKPTIVTIQNINILVPLLSREKLLCEKRDLSHILKTFASINNFK